MKRLEERVFKAWDELRQQRLFTIIYVAGTALAITFTMIYSLVFYVGIADIYPETNRSKTMYVDRIIGRDSLGFGALFRFNKEAFDSVFYRSKNVEIACAVYSDGNKKTVKGERGEREVVYKCTDPNFFRVYSYKFLQGKPFTWEDMEARNQQAVITDRLAEHLFGKDVDVVGKEIRIELNTFDIILLDDDAATLDSMSRYRICGVVAGGSSLTERSYGEVFTPYTTDRYSSPYLSAICLVKGSRHAEALEEELKGLAKRMSANDPEGFVYSIDNCLTAHSTVALGKMNEDPLFFQSKAEYYKHIALILLVLLVVPALNLCGLVAGRMEERLGEMAVRKSFGASRRTLLWQVIRENMRLTLLGGVVGLLLSIFIIQVMGEWVFGLFYNQNMVAECPDLSVTTFFSPIVFLIAFAFSGVLNLLAALIPAWWSLRKPIVESLMKHK